METAKERFIGLTPRRQRIFKGSLKNSVDKENVKSESWRLGKSETKGLIESFLTVASQKRTGLGPGKFPHLSAAEPRTT
jgi:hypothetical protein